jgi:hypothetical protein
VHALCIILLPSEDKDAVMKILISLSDDKLIIY